MARTKEQVVAEFRQAEILEAARRVFAGKGYEAATVDDIAAAASLAKGTLYLYFRSKREIFLAAMRGHLDEMLALTESRLAAALGTRGKLRAYFATKIEYLDQHRDFFRIYNSEFDRLCEPRIKKEHEFSDYFQRQAEILQQLLEVGIHTGEIRNGDVSSMQAVIHDVMKGYIIRHMERQDENAPREDVEDVLRFIWEGITQA